MIKAICRATLLLGIATTIATAGSDAGKANGTAAKPATLVVSNRLHLLPPGSIRLNGFIQDRIRLQAEVWFDEKTQAEMADIFRRRPSGFADGEFWGKAVRALSHHYEYLQDSRLGDLLKRTLADLMSTQTRDGCISGYAPAKQPYNTDVWDRKYALLGLIDGYEATGDPKVLKAAVRAADHLLTQVGPPPIIPVTNTAYITAAPRPEGGFQGIESSSILEPIVRLYDLTGRKEYLEFAQNIVEVEGGSKRGSIFEAAFAGLDVRDFGGDGIPRHSVAHAYSVISCFEGLAEFYRATGNEHWKQALLNMYSNTLAMRRSSSVPSVAWGQTRDLRPQNSLATRHCTRLVPCRMASKVAPTRAGWD